MDGVSESVRRVEQAVETCTGRQDFLADNLTDVRTTVHRIDRTQQEHGKTLDAHGHMLEAHGKLLEGHGKLLEGHGKLLERQSKTLEEHGTILRQILSKLDRN